MKGVITMTHNEQLLINIIRGANDPDAALAEAVRIILSVTQPLQASAESSPADTVKHS
jgi:hypothetical protein